MTLNNNRINASSLSAFLCGGSKYLDQHKSEIDALNVFPVPDGDTGVNMSLTVGSAAGRITEKSLNSGVGAVSGDFAMGALMGARGNSGVILSQIFRGFSMALSGLSDCGVKELAEAMKKGVDLSYKSVMKPVEGTILTVYRELTAAACAAAERDCNIRETLDAALKAGEKSLQNTPNLLPVLKEAGVVDAGGAGLLCFLQGGMEAVLNNAVGTFKLPSAQTSAVPVNAPGNDQISTADIKYAYCTQLLIKGNDLPIDTIREHLTQDPPGDSLLVVGNDTVVKIHFHNNHPGRVLEYCSQFGSLHDIIIDNMVDQHHENQAAKGIEDVPAPAPEAAPAVDGPDCGVISICCGEGMSDLFRELGASVISGGQTMNPSAEDILTAVEACNAKEIVILPNNSNIILTADQVKTLSDKPVEVVRSKYVTQGLSTMLSFDENRTAAENVEDMADALPSVVNGELTYSIRPAKFNGFDIEEGDILALLDGEIIDTGKDLEEKLLSLVEKMVAKKEDCELITLYWGNDLGEEKAQEYLDLLSEKYPDQEVTLYFGGQPLYYFLISVE